MGEGKEAFKDLVQGKKKRKRKRKDEIEGGIKNNQTFKKEGEQGARGEGIHE